MAKVYATGKLPTQNPAVFEGISFNEGMNYNNGVFLILDPGYYRIDVNLSMGYLVENKVECVLPMVISSEFRIGQNRDDDHREDEPHFTSGVFLKMFISFLTFMNTINCY